MAAPHPAPRGRGVARTRTGCMTCRKRKLKCDERKPVCGQCTKANRECKPSDPLAFRHQQNPSINEDLDSLKNFYTYSDTFKPGHVWVYTPTPVTFVYVTNPYLEENEGQTFTAPPSPIARTTGTYQNIASHSLEALSTAATTNQQPPSYVPQQTSSAFDEQVPTYANYSSPPRALRSGRSATAGTRRSNNAGSKSTTTASNATLNAAIDPNLESVTAQQDFDGNTAVADGGQITDMAKEAYPVSGGQLASSGSGGDPDQRVADLLRNFSET